MNRDELKNKVLEILYDSAWCKVEEKDKLFQQFNYYISGQVGKDSIDIHTHSFDAIDFIEFIKKGKNGCYTDCNRHGAWVPAIPM